MEAASVTTFIRQWYAQGLQWYGSHTAREKLLLAVFTASIASLLFLYKIWLPMGHALDDAQRAYSEKQELLQWMEHKAPQVKQQTGQLGDETHDRQALPGLLTSTAKGFTITIKRLELDKSGSVNLSLEKVPFNTLLSWLDMLAHAHNAGVQSLTVSKADMSDSVNVSLQIK